VVALRVTQAVRAAAIAFVVFSAVAADAQEDCLDFPSGGNLDPYYESWDRAQKTVRLVSQGKDPARKDLEAAIRSLREAIGAKSRPGRGRDPGTGVEFDYHPYLELALLEAKLGRVACVAPLLAKEQRDRLPQALQANYDSMMGSVQAWEADAAYRDLAVVIDRIKSTNQLSGDGQAKAEEIDQFIKQLGSGGTASRSVIAQGIIDLAGIEGQRISGYFDAVRVAAPSALAGIDESKCASPSKTEDPERLRAITLQIHDCMAAGLAAVSAGGLAACSTLQTERGAARNELDLLRKWGGGDGASPPANLPAVCLQKDAWVGTDLARLSRQFSGIDFEPTQNSYRSQQATFRQQVGQRRASYIDTLQAQENRIFSAPGGCESMLALGNANTELRDLQNMIRAARENPNLERTARLNAIGAEIDTAMQRLGTRAGNGADRLLDQKQGMADEGEDVAPFGRLETTRRTLDSGDLTEQTLTTLCRAASGVNDVIANWSTKNIPVLTARAQAYRGFLSAASALTGNAGVDCVDTALAALPQRGPSGNRVEWAKGTNTALTDAQACLVDYLDGRDTWIASVENDLTHSVAALSQLEGVEGLPQDRLGRMRGELEGSLAGLTRARAVLDLPAEASEADVRSGLGQAGVDAPAASWQQLDGLEESYVTVALKVIRAKATGPLVGDAADTASRWSTQISRLSTFAALDGAFSRFGDGDVDRAIVDLRGWVPDTSVDPETVALRHATLAYFLHTKWSLLPEDKRQQDVGALLYQDASREAEAAFRNDPGFELPRVLDNDTRFQQFVTNCCM